jgi:hypothetical protein
VDLLTAGVPAPSRSSTRGCRTRTAFLLSGDATNVLLQDQCPLRVADHTLVAHDGAVCSGIVDAIEGRPVVPDCRAL